MLGRNEPNGTTYYHQQGLWGLNIVRIITIAVNGYKKGNRLFVAGEEVEL
jgi:hypothetical protein